MIKLSARNIAIIAALVVMATMYFSNWLFTELLFNESQVNIKILAALVTGLITYIVTLFAISEFLVKRVKHIMKMIHKPEQTDLNTTLQPDNPLLADVEKEVAKFLKSQHQELTTLKDLERYRQDFVGNVAHELKTPIFNIQGYVHTLQDGALDDPQVNKQYLQKAADNIDRMIKIIEDLDSVYKLESNQMKLDLQPIPLNSFIKSVIEDVRLLAIEKNINILLNSDVSDEVSLSIDEDYIRQALINLLENSIKYGNRGGETTIHISDLDNQVLIEIQDNGPGIDAKHLRHVFDRFYRVDKARSRAAGGSGLGLSIVKHILEAHNQTIKVRSTVGEGTIFSFTLDKFENK